MTKAERKYCVKSRNWFRDGRRNGGVSELYLWNEMLMFGVLFAWPVTNEQMHKALKGYGCELQDSVLHDRGAEYVNDTKDDRHFVFFTEGAIKEDVRARNISHECLHVVGAALRHRGIPLNFDSEEIYAYLLGWMVGEVTGRMKP